MTELECFACEGGLATLRNDGARTWVACECGKHTGRGCDLSDTTAQENALAEWADMSAAYQPPNESGAIRGQQEAQDSQPDDIQENDQAEHGGPPYEVSTATALAMNEALFSSTPPVDDDGDEDREASEIDEPPAPKPRRDAPPGGKKRKLPSNLKA